MTPASIVSGLSLLVAAFLATVLGMRVYRSFALRQGILAAPNFRSLHSRPIPRGGGIVFAAVLVLAIAGLLLAGAIGPDLALILLGAGSMAALAGFADDTLHLKPAWKLLTQSLLAAFVVITIDGRPFVHLPGAPVVLELGLSWLALIWLMNLYNFMDGIDAMAASGAIFFSAAALILLSIAPTATPDVNGGLELIFGLIAATTTGFLIFNRPPASIFMGDAGSLFLGFTFGVLIAKSISIGQMSLWTWLTIFGYFAGDTTTTTIARIFVTRKWYGEHRSHAYQNLARIWASHSTVVIAVSLYHVFWLLPLAVWSSLMPAAAPLAALSGIVPVVVWTLRHGPLRSST